VRPVELAIRGDCEVTLITQRTSRVEGRNMARKREKSRDIVMKLRHIEVLQGQGRSTADVVRRIGVTQQTYCR